MTYRKKFIKWSMKRKVNILSLKIEKKNLRDFCAQGWQVDSVYLAENPLAGCSVAAAPGLFESPPSRGSFIHPWQSLRSGNFARLLPKRQLSTFSILSNLLVVFRITSMSIRLQSTISCWTLSPSWTTWIFTNDLVTFPWES